MIFGLRPNEGALPLAFGMRASDVRRILGELPSWTGTPSIGATKLEEHYNNFIGVHYDSEDRVYSLVFAPGDVVLRFGTVELLGPRAVANPLGALYEADPSPFEDVGFVVFDRIGVAVTGYHDDDDEQRAVTIMRSGTWTTTSGRPMSADELGL